MTAGAGGGTTAVGAGCDDRPEVELSASGSLLASSIGCE